jgi:signal transduction histidine kinase
VERAQDLLLDEVSMMSRLVDDLVVLAKADRPEFVVIQELELSDLTATVAKRAQALGDREWVVEAAAEGLIPGDQQRLAQAWMQLVANAVKFSEPGSRIALGSSRTAEQARLWVTDRGRGIADEDLGRVTERFQRTDDDVEGAGLGLPIVVAIARAHGGELVLDSELGVGTVAMIQLPMGQP